MLQQYVDNLNVLYEDNHVIVVCKYENILSQKDYTNDFSMVEIVKEYIRIKHNKPGNVFLGLVHRLDRRVGGVMVFAKTSKAASRISNEFRKKNVTRRYLACVEGSFSENDGVLIDYLKKDYTNLISVVTNKNDKDAKEAILKYRKLSSDNNIQEYSFLEICLVTGRYNQIRSQLSNASYPIVGDYKYKAQIPNQDRIGLWCHYLKFSHPVKNEYLEFTILPEGDFWDSLVY